MNLINRIEEIAKTDRRYPVDAYLFVMESLRHTLNRLGKNGHVTGAELLEGIRNHATSEFGLMAPTVFSQWGIKETDDFGEIVFCLVESKIWSKTETDRKEDFHRVYNFDQAFRQDFRFF